MAWRKVTGVLAAAFAGVLLLGSPAFAETQDLHLKASQTPTTAKDFGGGDDCGAPFSADMTGDGWHFVWQQGGDFKTVTLTFDPGADPDVTVVVDAPVGTVDSGPGWTAFFVSTGGPSGKVKHLYVFTPSGWTLTAGVGTGEGGSDTEFNLSHTCVGNGEEPPCRENCGPPPTCEQLNNCEPEKTETPGTPTETPTDPGNMPNTGSSLTGLIVTGAALVGAGAGLLLFLRRRRDIGAPPAA